MSEKSIPQDITNMLKSAGATAMQVALIVQCSKLNPEETIQFLGCLNRLMLVPNMDYWRALETAFAIQLTYNKTGDIPSGVPN